MSQLLASERAARRRELEVAIASGEAELANIETTLAVAQQDLDGARGPYDAAREAWGVELRKHGGLPEHAEQAMRQAEEPLQRAQSTHTRLNCQRSRLLGLLRVWRGELERLDQPPATSTLPFGLKIGGTWVPGFMRGAGNTG